MNRKIWLGLALILISYGELFIHKSWALQHHFAAGFPYSFAVAFFAIGTIILSEGVIQRFGGISLFHFARGGNRKLLTFLLVAAGVGVLAEILGTWLGKLWYYVYYPTWFYWPALIPSFILYWVMICDSYLAAKAVWDRFIPSGGADKRKPRYYKYEHTLYPVLGAVGGALLVYGLIALFFNFELHGYRFDPYKGVAYAPPLRYILMLLFGIWGVGEALLYMHDRSSLIRSILHCYFAPLLGVLTASLILSLVWETQNSHVNYWVYTNWPWPNLKLFGVQTIIFLAWPTNFVLYLILSPAIMPSWAGVFWSRPGQLKRKETRDDTATV